ncbi:MAG: alkaline phosphatase family protein, partial [Lactiplantibacillus plantarum]
KPDYQTTLLFNGPAVKAGGTIETANLVDEAPTFARLLGLNFDGPMPGHCLDGVFKD